MLGPTDHTLFRSIDFFDPNGHRWELAANTGTSETLQKTAPGPRSRRWREPARPPDAILDVARDPTPGRGATVTIAAPDDSTSIRMSTIFTGPDGQPRCPWCAAAPEFVAYHDTEWGYPVRDDRRLFEKISLEAFQSGLSWRTILVKRDNFRAAFDNFDFHRVARYTSRDVERLLGDAGIVRHRGKIEAVIHNAARAVELVQQEGSLAAFFWRYEPPAAEPSAPQSVSTSAQSVQLSKDLKKRGWKFVGPTTVYAFMQAMGLVNDHVEACVVRRRVLEARGG